MFEDNNLLEKCNAIWHKVSGDIKKEFDSKPLYNKFFLKTKPKSYGEEVTDTYDKEIPNSSNQDWFYSQERWKLLSASVFEIVYIHWKKSD